MFTIFGVTIANLSLTETVSRLEQLLAAGGKHLVVTANPEILLEVRRNPIYRQAVTRASLILADGVGVILASYLFRKPISRGRVTGVDLAEVLVAGSRGGRYSVFIAGSSDDTLNKTTQYFTSKYSNINIVGSYSEQKTKVYGKEISTTESAGLIEKLKQVKPDILLLAFGHPKQEAWLSTHLPELPVKLAIGVGGAFDYFAGQVPRPPRWLRAIGLEWLFRLMVEPRRWRRIYQAVVVFPAVVVFERLRQLFHVKQA